MTDRDKVAALFAAAWAWDAVEPLADWLADRLPPPGVAVAHVYRIDPPRACVVRFRTFVVAGVPGAVGAAVDEDTLAVHDSRHFPRGAFAALLPAWLRGAFAEVRRARAAADRP